MYRILKRLIDIILSVIGLIICALPFAVIAVLIKAESKGPVIFKQARLGLHGNTFYIYKFRSMCTGAEHMGSGQYSFKGDARVTKVGRIIRLLSIDELPQLYNILRGDMSCIGPRPTLTYHPWPLEDYTEEQRKRFSVRPGVTGLAQINGRKTVDWEERIKFDVFYATHLTFAMDLKIFFVTIWQVLSMRDNENTAVTVKPSTEHTHKV